MLGPAGLPVSSRTSMWPPLLPAVQAAKMTGADTLLTQSDDIARYGVYSLFPSSGAPQLCQPRFASASAGAYHPTHKVCAQSLSISDSLFGGYAFGGAPTPPPGSPYSPLRLELLSKTLSSTSCVTTATNDSACWMDPLQVKTEVAGCSRTIPAQAALLQVKREPQATPCQVSEISTSHHTSVQASETSLATAIIKMETQSPKSQDQGVSSIPVGIAVARQRLNQDVPLTLASAQILGTTQSKDSRCSEIGLRDSSSMISMGTDTILGTTSMPPVWPVTTTQTSLAPPTLWQYPAPLPLESVLPVPMPPVGVQLVRDPMSGHFILLPASTGLEPFQQTVVWPNYLLPPPLQPLQLSDYLSSTGTTLHQHTQTHSTRLVALTSTDAPKQRHTTRHSIVKLEEPPPAKEEPAVTAHLVYHQDAASGTSPACLTPPPDNIEPEVQDASNQTDDAPLQSDEDTQSAVAPEPEIVCEPQTLSVIQPEPVIQTFCEPVQTFPTDLKIVPEVKSVQEPIVNLKPEDTVKSMPELVEKSESEPEVKKSEYLQVPSPQPKEDTIKPDLSGLELLSNSIEEFETRGVQEASPIREEESIEDENSELDGLGLLCALAEKRFREEVDVKQESTSVKEEPCERKFDELRRDEEESKNEMKVTEDKDECLHKPTLDLFEEKLADLKRQYDETLKQITRLKPLDVNVVNSTSARKQSSDSFISSAALSPHSAPESCSVKTPSPCSSTSSSKKRKVGRPKKLSSGHGRRVTTETIFAKKPKTKGGIVGYLLSGKSTLSKGGIIYTKSNPRSDEEENLRESMGKVQRSKFNTEVKIDDDENQVECKSEPEESHKERRERKHKSKKHREKRRHSKLVRSEPVPKCALTTDHLEQDGLRVLCAMGGLFYAGRLSAVQAPDVYAVTLDGERGNRPHILSREEIMRDAFLELSPSSISEVPPGTRLCAYWSQQYRCLYPGTSASPLDAPGKTLSPEDSQKYVTVEFDDGDNGRIALEDIRLLEPNYPIVEYDPNPLLSLGKRKRRTSRCSTSDAPANKTSKVSDETPAQRPESPVVSSSNVQMSDEEARRERKRVKKHKRRRREEEAQAGEEQNEKKRRKKHRCRDEMCKRRHHKKHHKHRHRHRNEDNQSPTNSERTDIVRRSAFGDTFMTNINKDDTTPLVESTNMVQDSNIDRSSNKMKQDVIENSMEEESNGSEDINSHLDSTESVKSPMAAFLPARQLWTWQTAGRKGRNKKIFHRAIQRGHEVISVGDCAVFLSTASPTRPYIGRIECLWETTSKNKVRVRWFYHPEETHDCPAERLKYPGALFESPHVDENDVQTISHKCDVLDVMEYVKRLGKDPSRYDTIYENNDTFYKAGQYEPASKVLSMLPDVPLLDL